MQLPPFKKRVLSLLISLDSVSEIQTRLSSQGVPQASDEYQPQNSGRIAKRDIDGAIIPRVYSVSY